MGDENQGIITVEYECPDCYLLWEEDKHKSTVTSKFVQKKCDECEASKLSSRELLDRQIFLLDFIRLERLPEVIRNLYNHMQLKPLDE